MSTSGHPLLRLAHRLHRRLLWVLVGLLGGLLAATGDSRGRRSRFFSAQTKLSWPPKPCVVKGVQARWRDFPRAREPREAERTQHWASCGRPTCAVQPRPERCGRVPRRRNRNAATELAAKRREQLSTLNLDRDILLIDQRGTGHSKPEHVDATQYGTRMAINDLDAVRAALGYRQLDVIGSSYGATAAQVYAKLHPSSVRVLVLVAGTLIDVPIFARWAVNNQRASTSSPKRAPPSQNAGRGSPAGKASSARACMLGTPIRWTAGRETSSPLSSTRCCEIWKSGVDSASRQPRCNRRLWPAQPRRIG
jgi:pimeloyl-ACP methyl ester carboxylesterase